jgi:hypothetical protein
MKTAKFEAFIARSFSVGITIASPALNGLHIEVMLGCFGFRLWSRGKSLFKFSNYWVKQW